MRSVFFLSGTDVVGGIDTDAEESDISFRRSILLHKLGGVSNSAKLARVGAPARAFHLLLVTPFFFPPSNKGENGSCRE